MSANPIGPLSLLAHSYPADEMQPGYAAMRDALLGGVSLPEAFKLEVHAANIIGKPGRVRGAVEFLLRLIETYEVAGATYTLDPKVPSNVRAAMALPHGLRRSALMILSADEQTYAALMLASMVERMHASCPARFVRELTMDQQAKQNLHKRSGAVSAKAKNTRHPNLRHGAIVRN